MSASDDQAEVLFPERMVALGSGAEIEVRHMTWQESMLHVQDWRPLCDGMRDLVAGDSAADEDQYVERFVALFEEHPEPCMRLIRLCTDLTEEDVATLSTRDGHILMVTWLLAHLPFFADRLRLGAEVSAAMQQARQAVSATATNENAASASPD